jgi:hypothetical protein
MGWDFTGCFLFPSLFTMFLLTAQMTSIELHDGNE